MRLLIMSLLTIVFAASSANANYCAGYDVSDAAIQADLDAVADELNGYIHKDRAMRFAFRKLTRIDMKLKKQRGKITVPASIDDQMLMDIMADISDEIAANDHKLRKLLNTRRKLAAVKWVLKKKRIAEETPNDPALIEFDVAGDLDFGDVINSISSILPVTITNNGSQTATNISLDGLASPFDIASTTCGTELAVGASCTINVRYTSFLLTPSDDILEINYFTGIANDVATKTVRGNSIL